MQKAQERAFWPVRRVSQCKGPGAGLRESVQGSVDGGRWARGAVAVRERPQAHPAGLYVCPTPDPMNQKPSEPFECGPLLGTH